MSSNLSSYVNRAKRSPLHRKILSLILGQTIPFNLPHRFKIEEISDEKIRVRIPHRRSNFNHIKGIHACCLATGAELSSGLLLLSRLDPQEYRIIMRSLKMDYHYQAKLDAITEFSISDSWLKQQIIEPLKTEEAVFVETCVEVHDTQGQHLCTGYIEWQVKAWKNVKTPLKQ